MKEVEIRLNELMARKDIRTSSQLAKLAGLSGKHVRNIRNNEVNSLKLETILKLCKALDCKIDELIVSKDGQAS